MRVPLIAGNWKMHTTIAEAVQLVVAMRDDLEAVRGVEIVLCPPFVSLYPLYELLRGGPLRLGAQNIDYRDFGAVTGEIAARMVAPICSMVILGHSERRRYFGESDQVVNWKVKAALAAGLHPIVCVGEQLEENEAGATAAVVERQVRAALAGVTDLRRIVIAYEPVWAIGTGRAAHGPQANATIGWIRHLLRDRFGPAAAEETRILYGGSVTPDNIAEFVAQPEIDGALVGGASLRAADFVAICRTTADLRVPKELLEGR
ncbi:MAG: triose-phosphate isomerase [Chloroflexota bacterium]|nr:triose-phosphate isomerase [Dehalococcoidia bacterium]MDW8253740.1 triose-phosphate isomerase [Chloroflexota bacterium]